MYATDVMETINGLAQGDTTMVQCAEVCNNWKESLNPVYSNGNTPADITSFLVTSVQRAFGSEFAGHFEPDMSTNELDASLPVGVNFVAAAITFVPFADVPCSSLPVNAFGAATQDYIQAIVTEVNEANGWAGIVQTIAVTPRCAVASDGVSAEASVEVVVLTGNSISSSETLTTDAFIAAFETATMQRALTGVPLLLPPSTDAGRLRLRRQVRIEILPATVAARVTSATEIVDTTSGVDGSPVVDGPEQKAVEGDEKILPSTSGKGGKKEKKGKGKGRGKGKGKGKGKGMATIGLDGVVHYTPYPLQKGLLATAQAELQRSKTIWMSAGMIAMLTVAVATTLVRRHGARAFCNMDSATPTCFCSTFRHILLT
jgi:hypothetical protein